MADMSHVEPSILLACMGASYWYCKFDLEKSEDHDVREQAEST